MEGRVSDAVPKVKEAFSAQGLGTLTEIDRIDETTGLLMGALSDLQAKRAVELLHHAGIPVDYRSFEKMGHSMHGQDPRLFTNTRVDCISTHQISPA